MAYVYLVLLRVVITQSEADILEQVVSLWETEVQRVLVIINLLPQKKVLLFHLLFNLKSFQVQKKATRIGCILSHSEIEAKQLLFLCEMGLDPGIDHMSNKDHMSLTHLIKVQRWSLFVFLSQNKIPKPKLTKW